MSEAKDAENAFIKAQTVETEKYLVGQLEKLQQKFERLHFENVKLKKKEVSIQSYAKAIDTLNEVQSYLRSPSEKGGLGLDT